ncbi:MAG: outer membrane beta-barrel protein [Bacteroidota bacterium]
MNNTRHHSDVPFNAEFGWNQMSLLLDQRLPVKSSPAQRISSRLVRSLSLVSALLILSFQLNVPGIPRRFYSAENQVAFTNPTQVGNFSKPILAVVKQLPKTTVYPDILSHPAKQLDLFKGESLVTGEDILAAKIPLDGLMLQPCSALKYTRQIELSPQAAINQQNATTVNKKRQWQLSVGLAQNINMHGGQKIAPSPFADVTYQLSPRVFLSTGVQPYSRVINTANGVSKSGVVNDPQNVISNYSEQTSFKNLAYTDVPVFAGLDLSKQLAVQAGVQASFLVSKTRTTETVFYDNQRNPLPVVGNPPATTAAAPSPEVHEVNLRKVDMRFVAGIRYSLGKTAISLDYQQGFQSLLNGPQVSRAKNRLLSVKLLVTLK